MPWLRFIQRPVAFLLRKKQITDFYTKRNTRLKWLNLAFGLISLFNRIDRFWWFCMESLCKNAPSMLVFLKAPLLVVLCCYDLPALREKCPSTGFFWTLFSRIRAEYGVSFRIQSEYGKIRTRKNSVFVDTLHKVLAMLTLILLTVLMIPLSNLNLIKLLICCYKVGF